MRLLAPLVSPVELGSPPGIGDESSGLPNGLSIRVSPDSGPSTADGITSAQQLTIVGTSLPQSIVEILRDEESLGTTTAGSNGSWTFDYTGTTLAEGSYSFSAVATDGAGNFIAGPAVRSVTVDSTPPTSDMERLSDLTRRTDFTLTWSGTDGAGGSGVAAYDVYVAMDNGSYVPWKETVSETTAVFQGQNGHTYSFYSAAIDRAGNRESPPVVPDATTTIGDLPTAITLYTNHPSGAAYGQAVSFTAIVSAGGGAAGTPTGSVQWWVDGTPSGQPVILSGGVSGLLLPGLSAGTHSVEVTYTSNSPNYADSGPILLSQFVDQATLTVSADNQWKVYGDENPALTGSLAGLQYGDSITASFETSATAASPVGFYSIQPELSDPAGRLSNYRLVQVEGTLGVTPALLTVVIDNQTRVYGISGPELTAQYTGFLHGDTVASLTARPTLTTLATTASHVGSYPIMGEGGTATNYTFTYQAGRLEVTPAALTITADSKHKSYGELLPALTASYAGFVNGDTVASLATAPSLATTAAALSRAGTYPITASGAVSEDYTISYHSGSLTVRSTYVTIDQSVDQADSTNQTPIHFTAVFQDPVLNFSGDVLVLGGTAAGSRTVAVSPLTSDGRTFDVAVSGMTGTGTVTIEPLDENGDLIVTTSDNTVTYRPWQNVVNPTDINVDGRVSPLDILLLINHINAYGTGPLPTPPPSPGPPPYMDVDGDGEVTPHDVLTVINYVNSQNGAAAEAVPPEGESTPATNADPAATTSDGPSAETASVSFHAATPAVTPSVSSEPVAPAVTTDSSATFVSAPSSASAPIAASPDLTAQRLPSPTASPEWDRLLDGLAEAGLGPTAHAHSSDLLFTELGAEVAPV